ncbi:MAG: HDOD domain-containing protein [Planctomycetes bacterium]|nr:HDOD domain-containing protein [Planctomycetota bacterium]
MTISTSAELEDLIDGTVSIPTIPTVLTEITDIFNSPDGSAKEAGEVIEKDAAIATRVLRLVNSPFYGLKNPVSNINLACSILGLRAIKNLVVQATVLQTFGSSPEVRDFDANWLWDHSFKTAVACRMLADRSPVANGMAREDAYTCGLIHDIGKLILIDSQSDRFAEALRLSRGEKLPLAKAEGEVFGFNHAHVGGLLANRWKLASNVQAAVMYHHSPATNAEDWARGFLVKAANTFAHMATDKPNTSYIGDVNDADTMQALGLDEVQYREILEAAKLASVTS